MKHEHQATRLIVQIVSDKPKRVQTELPLKDDVIKVMIKIDPESPAKHADGQFRGAGHSIGRTCCDHGCDQMSLGFHAPPSLIITQ
ncbi:MAG: hypothetical protein C4291_15825 [Candidatus Dadabacteria bacterium]